MGAQSEENKGVELTGGGGNAGRWRESVGGRKFSSREDFDHTVWDVRLVLENSHRRPVEKSKAPVANPASEASVQRFAPHSSSSVLEGGSGGLGEIAKSLLCLSFLNFVRPG